MSDTRSHTGRYERLLTDRSLFSPFASWFSGRMTAATADTAADHGSHLGSVSRAERRASLKPVTSARRHERGFRGNRHRGAMNEPLTREQWLLSLPQAQAALAAGLGVRAERWPSGLPQQPPLQLSRIYVSDHITDILCESRPPKMPTSRRWMGVVFGARTAPPA